MKSIDSGSESGMTFSFWLVALLPPFTARRPAPLYVMLNFFALRSSFAKAGFQHLINYIAKVTRKSLPA